MMGLFGKRKIFDSTEQVSGAHLFGMQGKSIICPQCGNDRFELGSALLNTAGMTLMNLDWANRQASILTCSKCTHIQWFLQQPNSTG